MKSVPLVQRGLPNFFLSYLPPPPSHPLLPQDHQQESSFFQSIFSALGSEKNDYPELSFPMAFSGNKADKKVYESYKTLFFNAYDYHMNKDSTIANSKEMMDFVDEESTLNGDESTVMETIAAAFGSEINDYPELPFPTGFSGNKKRSRTAYDYGMTKGSGKN